MSPLAEAVARREVRPMVVGGLPLPDPTHDADCPAGFHAHVFHLTRPDIPSGPRVVQGSPRASGDPRSREAAASTALPAE